MQAVIALLWVAGTIYAVVNIVRPMKPITRRWQGAVALLGVFIVCGLLVDALKLDNSKGPSAPVAQPDAAATTSTAKDDFQIVRTNPDASPKGDPASAAADAVKAREEMKMDLRLIEAAKQVLVSALEAGNRDAVQMVRRDMQALDIKLIKRRPTISQQPWPVEDDEGMLACTDAAQRLSVFAASALQEFSLQEVAARQKFSEDYSKAHGKCKAWVTR